MTPHDAIISNGALSPEQVAKDPELFPLYVVRKLQQIDDRLRYGGDAIDDHEGRLSTVEKKVEKKLTFVAVLIPLLQLVAAAALGGVVSRHVGG